MVAKVLQELNDIFSKKTSYHSKITYRWRYEFKKTGLNKIMCSVSKNAKTATRLPNAAGLNPTYTYVEARLAQWIKDKRKIKIKASCLSICNVAMEVELTLCGGISEDYEKQVRFHDG